MSWKKNGNYNTNNDSEVKHIMNNQQSLANYARSWSNERTVANKIVMKRTAKPRGYFSLFLKQFSFVFCLIIDRWVDYSRRSCYNQGQSLLVCSRTGCDTRVFAGSAEAASALPWCPNGAMPLRDALSLLMARTRLHSDSVPFCHNEEIRKWDNAQYWS